VKVDVAIVGAGTAGAAAAWHCAKRGLETVALEAGPLERAGARWLNGVPGWCFDEAEVPRPQAPELRGGGEPFHLIAGWGPTRLTVRGLGVLDVDMALLVERLQGLAADAGARLVPRARVRGVTAEGRGARLDTENGPVEARWVVDASGLAGARLLDRPRPAREDLCSASQELRRLLDRPAAEAWFASRGAAPDETICFTGVAGGYSILNVRLHGDEVALLTGTITARGNHSGQVLLDRFADGEPWIGERLRGGARAIPIRRAYARLDEGPVALIGDAACQVFGAHGSGIGAGMIAARLLAEALVDGRGTWGYNLDWQRRFGGMFAASAAFAAFSSTMSSEEMATLMQSGLMHPSLTATAMEQRRLSLGPAALAGLALAGLRAPRLALKMAPVLRETMRWEWRYRRYPVAPEAVAAWAADQS